MRLGIFSDIHGNLEALERALAFFREKGVTNCLCLGDIVGYGASPNECVEMIKDLGCPVVAGNHDQAVTGRTDIGYFNDFAQEAILWTRRNLTEAALDFLDKLTLVQVFHRAYRLVHSGPSVPEKWRYVSTVADFAIEMKSMARSDTVCFIGHTHIPQVAARRPGRRLPQRIWDTSFGLEQHVQYMVNVGSVGQPRDGDPRLCVAVFETRAGRIEFHRLEYDVKSAQRRIMKAGLPVTLAMRLTRGL